MALPQAKKKKLIKEKEFVRNAKKVQESLREEENYLREKKTTYGDPVSSRIYPFS